MVRIRRGHEEKYGKVVCGAGSGEQSDGRCRDGGTFTKRGHMLNVAMRESQRTAVGS